MAPVGLPGWGLNRGREAKTTSRISSILSASINRVGYDLRLYSETTKMAQRASKFGLSFAYAVLHVILNR